MILIRRLRSFVRWVFRRQEAEQELTDELQDFIERSTRDKVVEGMSPKEADRISRIELGGVDQVKEGVRATRTLAWMGGFELDLKLGARMLLKYWGLTFAGGLALTIAIGIGAGWYDLTGELLHPTLPFSEGDRIVQIDMLNSLTRQNERRLLHDFLGWRRDVESITDLGAFRSLERNLILGEARPEKVTVAQITASAFRLARVPALLGRTLIDADEQPGAAGVLVLGYDLWQGSFGGREEVIGETLQLGSVQAGRRGCHAGRLRVPSEPPSVGATRAPRIRL